MLKSSSRLNLTKFTLADAPFILQILNETGFKTNIADRNVRSLEDAKNYLLKNIFPGYEKNGFSMFRVALNSSDEVVGMCGILKRDYLEFPDVGYAICEKHYRQGYAKEALTATLGMARDQFGMREIAAIISPHNDVSIRLVQNLGFEFLRMDKVPPDIEVKTFLKKL